MKIVVGASSLKTAVERINEGADELFCGYIVPEWIEKYGYIISPNRRWGKQANFTVLEDLKRVVKMAHENNVTVSITLNTHNYVNSQWEMIKKIIDDLVSIEIDAFIVADLGVLLYLCENYPHISVHISTGGTVFNRDAVGFYREFGVKRIIFPRSLEIDEVTLISDLYPELEFEVFMSNARCANVDGYCFFEHAIFYIANEGNGVINYPMCNVDYDVDLYNGEEVTNEKRNLICGNFIKKRNYNAHAKACGACYLFKLNQHNIKYVKIPARAFFDQKNRKKIVSEIKYIREMIDNLSSFDRFEDYEYFVREKFKEYFNISCNKKGINCYF